MPDAPPIQRLNKFERLKLDKDGLDVLPDIEVLHTVTPSPHHPLGVKGIGEAGTIASTCTVYNAVVDALRPLGVSSLPMPMTPERVWRAVQTAAKGA